MQRLSIIIVLFFFIWGCNEEVSIHSRAFVVDTHTDTPMMLLNKGLNLGLRHEAPDSRVDFPRLRDGEVDAIFFALFTNQQARVDSNYTKAYELANEMIKATEASVAENDNLVELVTSSKKGIEVAAINKTAIYFGMENGFPIAKDLNRVEEFYNKGVRYITLCHSSNNDICDSSTDANGPEHGGVSSFGEEVIKEMNRLGMLIDVSHISDAAFFDVVQLSEAPVIASHSSVRSLCDHPRNMNDKMIQALAENEGVIQICILGDYIKAADTTSLNYIRKEELRVKYNNWEYSNDAERKAAWAEWDAINREYPQKLPTIADAVDHIDYVANLVGVEHVGVGSDFDGGGGLADCVDVADFPKITNELLKRGYTDEEITMIMGGNFMRVFQQVEELAH